MKNPPNAAGPPIDRSGLQILLKDRSEGQFLDLSTWTLDGGNFSHLLFERVIFGCEGSSRQKLLRVDFSHATFINCQFRNCDLDHCLFPSAHFENVNLRKAQISGCDFRYSFFDKTTFAEAGIESCDFYRAVFDHNVVFERARLKHCSFHHASLEGSELDWNAIRDGGIVQADPNAYGDFLRQVASSDKNSLTDEKIAHFVAVGHLEAAAIFRKLSAVFAARGQFSESSDAYVNARRLERFGLRPSVYSHAAQAEAALRGTPPPGKTRLRLLMLRGLPSYLELWFSDLVCRFGTSVSRVLLSMIAVILGFAVLYRVLGAVTSSQGRAGFAGCLEFSLGKMLADVPDGLTILDTARPIAEMQVFISLALIGLFGFVLGNYFRQR